YQRRSNRSGRFRAVATTFNDHGHRELWFLERRDAEKPAVDARVVVVHDHFIVLANNVALVVLLNPVSRLRRPSLRIVNRLDLLRRSGLAPRVDSRCFHWSKHAARGSSRTASHEPHDLPESRGCLRRHHLIEWLRRHVVL